MAYLQDWFRDWRRVAEAAELEVYEPLVARLDGTEYEVLLLSRYDVAIDANKKAVLTSARHFDNHVAQLSRRTRDAGVVRVITFTGKPRYVLEPGAQTLEWAAAIEGVSIDALKSAAREAAPWRGVPRGGKKERLNLAQLEKQEASLELQIFEAEEEVEHLRRELRSTKRERALRGTE